MACFSNGGNTRLTSIKQQIFGTIPTIVDGDTDVQPFVSASPDAVRATIEDPSLNGTREELDVRLGAQSSTFDLQFAHRSDQYDDFLEAALFGQWSSDVLEVDSIENPMTLWMDQLDNGVVRQYKDCLPNTMTLDAQLDSTASLSFGMIGTGQELAASGDTDPTKQIANRKPYMHFDGNMKFNGTAIGYVQGVTVNLSNNLESVNVWGELNAACVAAGRSVVDISLTAQFKDAEMLQAFNDQDDQALEFTLNDPDSSTSQKWEFSRVRVLQDSIPVNSSGQIIQTIQLKALRNDTAGKSAIRITRT